MINITSLVAFLAGLVLLYIIGMILVVPVKFLMKLLLNGIVGGIALFFINIVGGLFGFGLAINPINALIVGIFGIPGIVLLFILQLVL